MDLQQYQSLGCKQVTSDQNSNEKATTDDDVHTFLDTIVNRQ